jgi:hypothetical protein
MSEQIGMTKQEFLDYWLQPDEYGMTNLDYLRENLRESVSQYRSECSLFGDAGPGQLRNILMLREEHDRVKNRLEEFSAELPSH